MSRQRHEFEFGEEAAVVLGGELARRLADPAVRFSLCPFRLAHGQLPPHRGTAAAVRFPAYAAGEDLSR